MNRGDKVLYFITGVFPFGQVETFIENEIVFLSFEFDKVVVLPSKVDEKIRAIPENFSIDKNLIKQLNRKNRKLKTIFSFDFFVALWDHRQFVFSKNALKRILSYVADVQATYSVLKKISPEDNAIIYTYWLNGKTSGAVKYREKNNSSLRIISRAHGYDLYEYRYKPAFWPYRQKLLKTLDRLYLISSDGLNYLRTKYNDTDKLSVSRLGVQKSVSIGCFSDDDELRILSVANLTGIKRIPLLFTLLNKFAVEHPEIPIKWTHFGDGEQMNTLLTKIKEGVSPNFDPEIKGRVSNKSIRKYYKNNPVDLFINISETEGLPVSIMEAQMYGKFVLATDVGGTKELLNNSFGKLLPKELCYDDFRKGLEYFLDNRKDITSMAEEIRQSCIEKYWADKNLKNFAKEIANFTIGGS